MRCPSVALLCLCCACGKAESGRTTPTGLPSPTTAATVMPGDALEMKIDGKPYPLKTVVATSMGGEAIRLELSKDTIACATLRPGLEAFKERITVIVAPQLEPDGSQRWAVADHQTPSHQGHVSDAQLTMHTEDVSKELRADIDVHSKTMQSLGDGPNAKPTFTPALDLSGSLRALGCGTKSVYIGDIPAEEQSELSVTLAGKRFAIRGATLVETPLNTTLLLSTQPHPCSIGVMGADLTIRIPVKDEMVTGASLHGFILPATLQAEKNDITVTPAGDAFTVSSSAILPGGYRLEMGGTIRPKRCKIGVKP